jgi:hypothetical protein
MREEAESHFVLFFIFIELEVSRQRRSLRLRVGNPVKTVVHASTVHVAHALVFSTVIVNVFFECNSSNQIVAI